MDCNPLQRPGGRREHIEISFRETGRLALTRETRDATERAASLENFTTEAWGWGEEREALGVRSESDSEIHRRGAEDAERRNTKTRGPRSGRSQIEVSVNSKFEIRNSKYPEISPQMYTEAGIGFLSRKGAKA